MRFWNIFGPDYRRNCLAWKHHAGNPIIPASGNTWKQIWTANPDVLEFDGRTLLYYRGRGILPGTDNLPHDRIGVGELVDVSADSLVLHELADDLPVIDVGNAGSFDEREVLDPAAIVFQGKVWLYYSAISHGPDSVGLAVSSDGVHFQKVGKVLDGRAPDVVVKDGKIVMLYQALIGKGQYAFFLASSEDGIHFTRLSPTPVFAPTGGRAWDGYDVTTGRLHADGDGFLLLYGGSTSLVDQPDYVGIAQSTDLLHWERHPGNPIFGCGPKGSEDGGAIWFPALIETATHYVLLYEGSRGNYQGDLSSQICMASIGKSPLGL